ncbi:MAG: HD domain-containing phosphohydrolase, partial [Planctomycetota bacterium]
RPSTLMLIAGVLFTQLACVAAGGVVFQSYISERLAGWVVGLLVITLTLLLALLFVRNDRRRLREVNRLLKQRVEDRTRQAMSSRDAVIFGLAKLAESRDAETGHHLERVCAYVDALARHLAQQPEHADELDECTLQAMATTAALHDIGKVGIPDAILNKPGSLTDHERAAIQRHTTIGGDTLIELKQRWGEDAFLVTASQIALQHHEKWDGSGYPFGLVGEHIALSARIVAVADVYDALRSRRPYKQPMTHDQAADIIAQGRGSHFDPTVVDAFARCRQAFETIHDRYIDPALDDEPPTPADTDDRRDAPHAQPSPSTA